MTGTARVASCAAVLLLVLVPTVSSTYHGTIRRYYIAAEEVNWNYFPDNEGNKINPGSESNAEAETFVKTQDNRIGSVYQKTLYVEYTDDTFSEKKDRPSWLGLTGPVIRGEVGDTLLVTFFNNASRPFSMHSHGVRYAKASEGAGYNDGTSAGDKAEDAVAPGRRVTLTWHVTSQAAPPPRGPACLAWAYHSHVNTPRDTSSGLIGVLVTCRKGTLDADGKRTDVDHDFPLLVKTWDENMSWHFDQNMERCQKPSVCRALAAAGDAAFTSSNHMAALNGRMYGQLDGLDVCQGEKLAFYVVGLGNEFDIHSLHFQGLNLHFHHQRGDTVSVFSATFVSVEATPRRPGDWLIADMAGTYRQEGMGAFLHVTSVHDGHCSHVTMPTPAPRHTAEVFLKAEELVWDPQHGANATYSMLKAVFRGYSNASFADKLHHDHYMGTLGPALHVEAGWELNVTLKNDIAHPLTFLPHGLIYDVSLDEGAGMLVQPSEMKTLTFEVPTDLFNDSCPEGPDCVTYIYTSGYLAGKSRNTGLVGPLVVCRPGFLTARGDKELPMERFLLFQTVDETQSFYYGTNKDNIETTVHYTINGFTDLSLKTSLWACAGRAVTWRLLCLGGLGDVHGAYFHGNTFLQAGHRRDTAGLVPGSTADLHMVPDNPGTWMVHSMNTLAHNMGMGALYKVYPIDKCQDHSADVSHTHSPQKLVISHSTVPTTPTMGIGGPVEVFTGDPMFFMTMNYTQAITAGNVTNATNQMMGDQHVMGNYFGDMHMSKDMHDHNPHKKDRNGHNPHKKDRNGHNPHKKDQNDHHKTHSDVSGKVHEIYIAAEDVEWDYFPANHSVMSMKNVRYNTENSMEIFVRDDDRFIGSVYRKAVYRRYTDASFTSRQGPEPRDAHKALLGPVLRLEVGDTVRVTFKNLASIVASLQPHGLRYSHADSGRTMVKPGDTRRYTWEVPERAGPGPRDPACLPWLYHSGRQYEKVYAGLQGGLVVCRAGTLDAHARRTDGVDHEFFLLMQVSDENKSPYIKHNVQVYAPARVGTDYAGDEEFEESNIMHGINGRLSGALPPLVVRANQTVVWYFMALGAQVDLHTVHLHGQTFRGRGGVTADVAALLPGMAEPVTMAADNPGTWLLHCHQMDHISAGMQALYTILDNDTPAMTVGERCLGGVRGHNHYLSQTAQSPAFPLTAFEAMCRDPERVPECYAAYLPHGSAPERLMSHVTSQAAMTSALQGLCVLGLPELRTHAHCLAATEGVRRCYGEYKKGVAKWAAAEGAAPDSELAEHACKVTVSRFACQTAQYRRCSPAAARAMHDFLYAAMTPQCRQLSGETSSYTDYVADGARRRGAGVGVTVLTAMVAALAPTAAPWRG